MVVWELRKALEQFAPNAEVVLIDGEYGDYWTPTRFSKVDDDVLMEYERLSMVKVDERETNP